MLNVFKLDVGNDITQEKYDNLKKQSWFHAYNEICNFNKYYLEDHSNLGGDLKVRFNYRFVHGILMEEIRKIARHEEIDLIVLPVSDKKVFNKRQLKIIRDNIYENNRTSVLVVPFQCVFQPIENIVFATDFKLNDFKRYLDDVVHFAKVFDSNIHFLHIAPNEKAEKWESTDTYQVMKRVIENNKRHVSKCLYGKDVVDMVNHYVDEIKADLLIVVKHQHYFLDTVFHESVSDKISFESKIPVLVMREKRY